MALGSTQLLTERVTGIFLGGRGRPACEADNLTAICQPTVYKMWEPQPLSLFYYISICAQQAKFYAGFEVLTAVYKEYYLLGYNAVYSVENKPTFRRNISPRSSGSKNKPNKKPA
jgi:hypothetical protein